MKNNKGFSLIEVIVTFAVSAIIISALLILVSNATKGYTTQSASAQIQNDIDMTMSQVTTDVYEADHIVLKNDSSGKTTFLGTKATNSGTSVGNMTGYFWDTSDNCLYYVTGAAFVGDTVSTSTKSLVCAGVENFSVKIKDACITQNSTASGLQIKVSSELLLNVTLKLKSLGKEREVSKDIQCRNPMDGRIETELVGSTTETSNPKVALYMNGSGKLIPTTLTVSDDSTTGATAESDLLKYYLLSY